MHVLLPSVFAIVGTSLAFPQNSFGSSGQCPTGCANVVVTENDNPDPHQAYFFQQMTVSKSKKACFCPSWYNVLKRITTNAEAMVVVRSLEARQKAMGLVFMLILAAMAGYPLALRSQSTRSQERYRLAMVTQETPSAYSGDLPRLCTRSTHKAKLAAVSTTTYQQLSSHPQTRMN